MISLRFPRLKFERIVVLTGADAIKISALSVVISFMVFGAFLSFEGADPLVAYEHIFSFAFDPKLGLPTTLHRGFFLVFNTNTPSRWNLEYRHGGTILSRNHRSLRGSL